MRKTVIGTACAGALLMVSATAMAADGAKPKFDLLTYTPPSIDGLPDDEHGKLVRYGHALAVETYRHIGPEVADPAMRYSGNNLACQSCHLNAATQPYSMPWTGVASVFPQYRGREDAISTVEDRVNGCMQRSMAGKPLPEDSREMKAFLAYIAFLSQDVPKGAEIVGAGVQAIAVPNRRANPERGAEVFAENCAVCHGEDGMGKRRGTVGDAQGYEFPPVWGQDSYNNGAGMYRLAMATRFVVNNMPLGSAHDAQTLSLDDAYDVMAFVNSQPRGEKPGMEKDFPNLYRKPPDMPFPPFVDSFPLDQHKYGPFAPIVAETKRLEAEAKAEKTN
ncbi:c-type cytochrome [Novispirillum sp. DQ9]|uniref:c-type cytochrome n=1 Tax=Novispirillum sp. DQ9 TaxID=3398612 RepID=UPI003C7E19D2